MVQAYERGLMYVCCFFKVISDSNRGDEKWKTPPVLSFRACGVFCKNDLPLQVMSLETGSVSLPICQDTNGPCF
jgi:hypothetical protein